MYEMTQNDISYISWPLYFSLSFFLYFWASLVALPKPFYIFCEMSNLTNFWNCRFCTFRGFYIFSITFWTFSEIGQNDDFDGRWNLQFYIFICLHYFFIYFEKFWIFFYILCNEFLHISPKHIQQPSAKV